VERRRYIATLDWVSQVAEEREALTALRQRLLDDLVVETLTDSLGDYRVTLPATSAYVVWGSQAGPTRSQDIGCSPELTSRSPKRSYGS
jgi:hypothetical protein